MSEYVSKGIWGQLKSFLIDNIFNVVKSSKILTLDEFTLKIINSCMDQYEHVEFGILNMHKITENRNPITICPAIYFISPTKENIDIIINDFQSNKEKYKFAHIFFTTNTSTQLIKKLINIKTKIKTLIDLQICDFIPTDALTFDMQSNMDFMNIFGGTITIPYIQTMLNILSLIIPNASSKCVSEIRHMNSKISTKFALDIFSKKEQLKSLTQSTIQQTYKNVTLLILDRSYNMLIPFMQQFAYSSLIDEFKLDTQFDKNDYLLNHTIFLHW